MRLNIATTTKKHRIILKYKKNPLVVLSVVFIERLIGVL
jgi:hypothetical protein